MNIPNPVTMFNVPNVGHLLERININTFVPAIIFLAVGFILARVVSSLIANSIVKSASPHDTMIARRISFYGIMLVFIFAATDKIVDISSILGAAGVVTLVAGFASRTAISNIISGVLLITEKPFMIGDYLEYDNIIGEVIAIDLMAVKLRTRENTFVRIPNEILLQTKFCNLTKFPIRRFDFLFKVNFQQNIAKVRKILFDVAQANPLALESPEPELFVIGFGDYAVELKFAVWCKRDSYYTMKTQIAAEIQEALNHHHIEIPVPKQSLQISEKVEFKQHTLSDQYKFENKP